MGLLANDTFSGTNGTNLTAHTLDSGGAWTAQSGTVTLNGSNQATNTVNTALYTTPTSASDVRISLDLTTLAAGYTGIILRWQDSSNYIFCVVDVADGPPTRLSIWKRVAGSNSAVVLGTWVGVPATIVVTAIGSSITMSDGTNSISATISNFSTQTTHGLYFAGGSGGVVDNFQVYNIMSVTLTPNSVANIVSGSINFNLYWSPTDAVKVEDGTVATAGTLSGSNSSLSTSYSLACTNFNAGSVIDSGASIFGFQVGVKKRSSSIGSLASSITDSQLQLAFGGSAVGTNKADSSTVWPGSLAFEYYGGPADTFGWVGFTTANVLDSTFGVRVQAHNANGSGDGSASIDVVTMTFYYSPSSLPTFFQAVCPMIIRKLDLVPY